MNVTVAPFDNVNVRMALKYAIDRKAIVDKVFYGHGTPGNDNPIAPTIQFAIDPQPRHDYDPEKAKAYLKKAGLDSLKVDLSVADAAFAGAVDAALLYKDSAAKAGIDINVIREPDDGYWDNVWLKKPWCMSYWNGRPTVRLDVHHRLCRRCGVERHVLEESAVQRAADGGAFGDRREEARGDVCRNAADPGG